MSAVLGIPTMAYLPYCIFNILSPILTVLLGYTGLWITRVTTPASKEPAA
jgi:NhaC family Na+:H+ antiporter